ncbi:GDSL lipase/esterase [Gongronella butleri]|nr:GDSL lipase/esterase [Gongronella butleri]
MIDALICIALFVLLGSARPVSLAARHAFELNGIKTLFVFGDSYSTKYLDLNSLSYPDPSQVSSTNGFNWVDYFTKEQNLTVWDIAYNSAPISDELVHQNASVIDVTRQVTHLFPKYFLKDGKTWQSENTLYAVFVGINDLGLEVSGDQKVPLTRLIEYYRNLVVYLHEHHARNFIFINVPPIEKSPKWKSGAGDKMPNLVREYNQLLKTMVLGLQNQRNGFFYYVDAWAIFNDLLSFPRFYGFKNVTGFCPDVAHPQQHGCDPINDYFWLNDLHPTTHVHKVFADQLRNELNGLS